MSKIHILSEDVRNKIAAGEVIERPASVVKELVENSIDADSTSITIIVENGGKDLIQVIDNGCGLDRDDALLAFDRHATSKIKTLDDITSISTLGFRGEALSSIASVSNLTMVTKTAESDTATIIEFSNGKLINISQTSSNPGTIISVKGLFKNIPARRKFLKSDTIELKHIIKYITYQTIIFPNISFKLITDGRERFNYIAVDSQIKRLSEVFGSSFLTDDIITVDIAQNGYRLHGYIYGLEERNANIIEEQYVFINGRFIIDKTIKHSIRSAYEPFISKTRSWKKGTTPPYILQLDIPATDIDVNVHPAKSEVRFRNQQFVHSFVYQALQEVLMQYEERKFSSAKEKFHHASQMGSISSYESALYKNNVDIPKFSSYSKEFGNLFQGEIFQNSGKMEPADDIDTEHKKEDALQRELFPDLPNDSFHYQIILKKEEDYINPWQLHYTYIFIQVEDGLVVIDQHAAHERIIYERLIHRTKGAPAIRQKLIVPLVIDVPVYLTGLLTSIIETNFEIFEKTGFSIKKFSGNSIVIEEVPAELEDWQSGEIIVEILKQLQNELEVNHDFRDSLAKSIACKAAIKAGKALSRKEMLNLINELFACQIPYFCPHGRPLIIKMPLTEFERRFKRTI